MARLRSKGSTFGSAIEPEAIARTRSNVAIRHSPRSAVPMPSIEVESSPLVRKTRQRSTKSTRSQAQPSSSKGRVTRSMTGNEPHYELSPAPPRKRRSDVNASQEQLQKRQRSTSHESAEQEDVAQPDQQDEAVDQDEESIPSLEFLDGINKNIGASVVLNRRPSLLSNASVENPAENDDGGALSHIDTSQEIVFEETTIAAPGGNRQSQSLVKDLDELEAILEQHEAVPEVPQSAQPVPQPSSPQSEPQQSSQRKIRRPKKNASYYELNQGPDSPGQSPQPTSSRNFHVDETIYDVPESPPRPSNQTTLVQKSQKAPMSTGGGSSKMKQKQRSSQSHQRRSNVSTQHQDDEQQREHSQEESEESGDDGSHFGDSEPEINQQDSVPVVDDSLLLDAPPPDSQEAGSTPTTCIKRVYVQKLVHIMTLRGWMGKRFWKDDFLDYAADKSDKLARQPDYPVSSVRILAKLFDLYELCKEIPKSPQIDQLTYLREHAPEFSNLVSNLRHTIDSSTSNINNIMKGGDPSRVEVGYRFVMKLQQRIIPMLVLLLDTAFEAGCGASLENGGKASQQTGEFTVYLLEPLERAAGWARRLSQVVEGWYELHPPKREEDQAEEAQANRAAFRSAVATLKSELGKARRYLEKPRPAPEELMRKDEDVRREREAKQRERQEKHTLQMQRFRDSIQRINSHRRPAKRRPVRQEPVPRRPSPPRSAPSQPLSEQEYYERHGWHYWEDDQILTLIRTTAHPNYENFQQMLPGRSPEELRERSGYLKLVVRNKYQRRGITPPGFCVDED